MIEDPTPHVTREQVEEYFYAHHEDSIHYPSSHTIEEIHLTEDEIFIVKYVFETSMRFAGKYEIPKHNIVQYFRDKKIKTLLQ